MLCQLCNAYKGNGYYAIGYIKTNIFFLFNLIKYREIKNNQSRYLKCNFAL